MRRWQSAWRLIPLMAVLTFVLTGCGLENLTALDPKGPVAEKQLSVIYLSLIVMIGVFAVVMIIYVYVLVRFRKRPGQSGIPKQVEGNHKLEIIWTVIPIILLVILGVPTIKSVFGLAEDYTKDPNAIQVKVTAHQYWWEFEYPNEGVKTAQELIIPNDAVISIEAKTADVLHSFWIPSLAGKIDTNPGGNVNTMYFKAPKEGVYLGKCAELCGPSHALMDFKVKSVDRASYDRWVAAQKAPVALPADAQLADTLTTNCLS